MRLLLNGVGDLVIKKTEKHKIFNVFLASFLSSKISFRNPKPWNMKTQNQGKVEDVHAGEHINKLDMHRSMEPNRELF